MFLQHVPACPSRTTAKNCTPPLKWFSRISYCPKQYNSSFFQALTVKLTCDLNCKEKASHLSLSALWIVGKDFSSVSVFLLLFFQQTELSVSHRQLNYRWVVLWYVSHSPHSALELKHSNLLKQPPAKSPSDVQQSTVCGRRLLQTQNVFRGRRAAVNTLFTLINLQ